MPDSPTDRARLRVSELRQRAETRFRLEPESEARKALATALNIDVVRKLRFDGVLRPRDGDGWLLDARLGATVVQPCVVTLEPVTTRIDTPVSRRFVPAHLLDQTAPNSETEMPEDDTVEPLGDVIDLDAVMTEALSLSLTPYPRKDGAELGETVLTEDGVQPLRDADVKPFAGLAALRGKLTDRGDGE